MMMNEIHRHQLSNQTKHENISNQRSEMNLSFLFREGEWLSPKENEGYDVTRRGKKSDYDWFPCSK